MYNLPHFKEKDPSQVSAFMRENPFALLLGADLDKRPVATHVPLLIEERDGKYVLRGHIMKGTDHHKAFESNPQVLAVFNGPHTYISASWYENKQQASTWNYMTVHASGILHFLGEEELVTLLDELTSYFENNPESPSLYSSLDDDYLKRLQKAIVAFEIRVDCVDHVFKLSQNRDLKSYENIMGELEAGDYQAKSIALEMRKRKDQLYNL